MTLSRFYDLSLQTKQGVFEFLKKTLNCNSNVNSW